ncbi:restriction endonuclease subunit S domain-containing protein [Faecalimonas sp.]
MSNVYETYVDVDEKWVKKIPAHWQMKRLKAIFAMRKEKNNPVVTENILSLTAKQGVVPYAEKEGTGGNKPKSDMTQYNIAHENDLLVNCMNVVSGAAGVSRYFGAISPVYYALYPHNDENVWYYHHIFRLMPFQRSLVGLGKGILMHESDEGTLTSVRMRISMDYLGNVLLPVPPRDEQDQIVKYLNWKVSDINKLIGTKRKELKKLYDLKKTLIKDVVTCGVSKEATKKSSKIDWIGEIKSNYEIIPLKRLLKEKLQYGANESGIPFDEQLPRYIRITDITLDGELKNDGKLSLTEETANGYILQDGNILLARSGATVGKSFYT